MTIGERIRRIRKENGLTLDKFGERIGIGKGSVSMMESGKSNVTNQTVLSICREFGVSEAWLREGVGDMAAPEPDLYPDDADLLAHMAEKYGLDNTDRALLSMYLELGPDGRGAVRRYAAKLIGAALEDAAYPDAPLTDEEIAAKTEAYYRLLKGAKETGDALNDNTRTLKFVSGDFGGSGKAG